MPESSSGDAKTDREKFLQQIIRHIRALLISAPSGLNVVEIQNDYLKIIGKPLPYREAGFNSAIELLQALPDVVRPTWIRGELILRGIADETSKRVANLVARQKKVSKKRATHVVSKRPLMLPVVPYYVRTKIEELLTLYPSGMLGSMFCAAFERHFQVHLDIKKLGFSLLTDLLRTIPNTARIEAMKGGGYRVHGISSQKSSFSSKGESTPSSLMSSRPSVPTSSVARSSTSNTQSSTSGMDKQRKSKEISASKKLDNMKVFLDSRNSVSETLRREIAEILHERPNGVWCARLPVEYKKMYRKDLSVRDHGFTSVIELADAIPDVVRIDRPVKTGDWLLHSNSKKNPETPFSEPRQVDHDFKPEARAVPPSGPGRPPPKETLVAEDGVGAGTYYPKLTVRQAGYIDMYVTHPVDPHNFWVMLIENWPKLEALAEDIRVFYSSADGDRYTMPEWFVSVGQVCCALYDEDGAWYRALITSVNSIHNIEVLYVDYGNRSRVPLQNLRILRASFIKLPAQSVHAQLAYIKPTQGSEWTPGCCHRFYRITKDFKPLVGLLCGVKDETLSLCLCDTNHSDDIHINDMLVEEGYAVFSPSSSPPPSAIPEDTNSKDKHKAPEQLPVISHAPGLPPPRKEQQFFNSNIVPAMAQSQIPDFPMHFAVNYSSDILSYLNGNLPDTSGMPLVQVPGDQEPLCSDEATVSKQGDDMSEEEMAFMQEVCHELDESPTEESILKRIGLMGICTIHIINHEKKPYVTSADISALFWDSDLLRPMLRQKKMAIAKLVLSHDDHGALLDELVRGLKKKKGKKVIEPFRKDFGTLCSLRSFCTGIPLLAMTGTANEKIRATILKELVMKPNTVVLNISPDRHNIRFTVVKTKRNDHLAHLQWLIDLIKKERLNTPKTIIFCNTIQDVAKLTGHLLGMLGDAAYIPDKPLIPVNRLVGIYHSMTWPKYKARVSDSFKQDIGNVRVVIATSALSMGVNFPDVVYVIHMGPARSTVDHIQEAGRAGRNGLPSHNIIIFYGNQLAHCEKAVKDFCRTEECIRQILFKYYALVENISPQHSCCSNCDKRCTCDGVGCKREQFPFDNPLGTPQENAAGCERVVSDEDKTVLQHAMFELKGNLNSKSLSSFGSSTHGFSDELIEAVVEEAGSIFSISDLISRFPVFNVFHAKLILEIFQEIFEDIQGFEEMLEIIPEDLISFLPVLIDNEDMLGLSDLDSDPDEVNSEELENLV